MKTPALTNRTVVLKHGRYSTVPPVYNLESNDSPQLSCQF